MHSLVHEVTARFTTILNFSGFALGRRGVRPLFEENLFENGAIPPLSCMSLDRHLNECQWDDTNLCCFCLWKAIWPYFHHVRFIFPYSWETPPPSQMKRLSDQGYQIALLPFPPQGISWSFNIPVVSCLPRVLGLEASKWCWNWCF